MALKRIAAPVTSPVTLEEAKAHLRAAHNGDDEMIGALIKAATDHAEQFLGRALIAQTWELVLDKFPTAEIKIPLPPLSSIVSIKYDDGAGFEQTVDTANYTVDDASEPGWVIPHTGGWPSTIDAVNSVRIRFIAGYPDDGNSPANLAANVPYSIKAAILMTVGTLYEHRETIVIGQTAVLLPWAAEQLLRPYRVHTAMA